MQALINEKERHPYKIAKEKDFGFLSLMEHFHPEFYSCFNKKMPFFSVIMGNYDIFYIVQSKYLNFSFEYMIFK